jgi:hypothetical protein
VAAGTKVHQVVQEPSGLGELQVVFRLKLLQVAAKKDPLVKLVQRAQGKLFAQEVVAERVERREAAAPGRLAELPRRALAHLLGGFAGEGQRQDVFGLQAADMG